MRREKRVVLFNHKGGVGKTTLTANLAFALAELGKRVLLVDGDPQGNLTSYLIEESVVNDLLDTSDEAAGRTLWSALKPVAEGAGGSKSIAAFEVRNNIWLLPGDIRLAEFEAELSAFWGECFQRRVRGFRGSQALANLVTDVSANLKCDFVLYDCGPNIGSLTRVILLDVDNFIVPAACDLFSTRAIKTVGHTLARWIEDWISIGELAPADLISMAGRPRFTGFIPQRFRIYGGAPSIEFAKMLPSIERAIREDVIELLTRIDPQLVPPSGTAIALPEIKDFGSLSTSAQKQGIPLWHVKETSEYQREEAKAAFYALSKAIAKRVGVTI